MDDVALVGAVDQGTSSTRFLIFTSQTGELLTYHQIEISQQCPHEGWVEQDPMLILNTVTECITKAVENLENLNIDPDNIKAIGITNQRETTIVWDKVTGKPLYNAIVWLDVRNAETVESYIKLAPQGAGKDIFRSQCGLPISTYFSALKIRWLLDNVPEVKQAVENDSCLFGNVDSWLLWNLTGGVDGGKHSTDVTNASRTMLMNIHNLQWDLKICEFFNIPVRILPEIKSSSEIFGYLASTSLKGVPISGILGDQQAALVGQGCFQRGQAKNTYGTGCFLLYNTGEEIVHSEHGLLTTIAYKFGKHRKPRYALEGSIAVAGAAVTWLRDNLGIIKDYSELESLVTSILHTHDCYFVPAFSGLFCPYWQSDARGIICGLTQYTNKSHIARACLEAICFQTRELLEAMDYDSGTKISSLYVDGGMSSNSTLMQIQSDLTGLTIVRPSMIETTALGAAIAAGAAEGVNVWTLSDDTSDPGIVDTFLPSITCEDRDIRFLKWKKAVKKSMDWKLKTDEQVLDEAEQRLLNAFPLNLFLFGSFLMMVLSNIYAPKR